MPKKGMNIIATKEGFPIGYVGSISETEKHFKIVADKKDAKSYTSEDKIQGEIDVLTRISSEYVFLYE